LLQYQPAPFPFPDTPQEFSRIWCKPQEFLLFKHDAKRDCRNADEYNKRHFKAIYNACKTAEGLRSIHTADSAALAAADYRGLEHIIFRSLHDRKPVVHGVILKQDELKSLLVDSDDQIMQLSHVSRSLSQQARRIARVFGTGDAYVARGAAVARVTATR
jgi:hypothetical protein